MQGEKIVLNEIEQLRYDKLVRMQNEGKDPFKVEKFDQTHHSKQIKDDFENFEGKEVSVAGRMMSFRSFGKSTFVDVQDKDGKIQCYAKKMNLEKTYTKRLKNLI